MEQWLYAVQDANGDVVATVTYSGIAERYGYTPYGVMTALTVAGVVKAGGSDLAWTVGHQGLLFVADAGMYANRARWYSPTLMRFASTDPLMYGAGDANIYRYVGGNPASRNDPSGEVVQALAGAVIGAVAGIAVNGISNRLHGKDFWDNWGAAAASGALAGLIPGFVLGAGGGAFEAFALGGGAFAGLFYPLTADNPNLSDYFAEVGESALLNGLLGKGLSVILCRLKAIRPGKSGTSEAPPSREGGSETPAVVPNPIADAIEQVRAANAPRPDCTKCAMDLEELLPGGRRQPIAGEGLRHEVYNYGGKVLDPTASQYVIPSRGGVWTAEGLSQAGLRDAVELGIFTPEQHAQFLQRLNERYPGTYEVD